MTIQLFFVIFVLNIKYLVMKNLFVIFALLFTFLSNSQTYSEKYNSLYDRFEYYDSDGDLIGYKKWSALNDQWEFFSVKKKSTKNGYIKPVNLSLINKALSTKQKKFERNEKKILDLFDEIIDKLNGYESERHRKIALNLLEKKISTFFELNQNLDYSSDYVTRQVMNKLMGICVDVIEYTNNVD